MKWLSTLLFAFSLSLLGCSQTLSSPAPVQTGPDTISSPVSAKTITSFVVTAAANPGVITADVSGNIASDTINLAFDKGTRLSRLVPTITITGKAVSPASNLAENFDSTLVYIVTAHDGSSQAYQVVVSQIN